MKCARPSLTHFTRSKASVVVVPFTPSVDTVINPTPPFI